ncbi:uridine kinase-like protein [Leishmania braziliensis MHOM/BR/75/M2904]|uniref:Uridine kinase n=2 Tax=Leishmania braziliensis TaxID=5660 RepID=A4HJN5_LEIBR|nr:uridine kinase-like protein [Leishmania braziliensis MHOM/BR/75/M2904]KAI5687990.1 AAA domain [Leishmania braziliensis]CAJ2478069.1 unnamed protein product [Leishmania braziliensis]CAM42701.1 uridine kinase-like protein [Leishmania braziliensis MHOM/BR/75/M2904]SYZ68433.1 uridine_kinase-like_protein [Leishmania braziliensis MHOM/BR/75/M2904]
MPCTVIGISGASGSGKSSLSTNIVSELMAHCGPVSIGVICEDFYYRDQSNIPESERAYTNYDHPKSLEHDLLTTHLRELKSGKTVQIPQYDYVHHTRSDTAVTMTPKSVLIVEGILLFTNAELRNEMDCLIFVDTPLDICLIRRAKRDMRERGRTFESVVEQYEATVRPMYYAYVEPSKVYADIIVPSWKDNSVAVGVLRAKLNHDLENM